MADREEEFASMKRQIANSQLDISFLRHKVMKLEGSLEDQKSEREKVVRENQELKERGKERTITRSNLVDAEWNATHGGKIREWSTALVRITQEELVMVTRKKTLEFCVKAFGEGRVPDNLPNELKGFKIQVPEPYYPDVMTVGDLDKWRGFGYDVLLIAATRLLNNLNAKHSANDKLSGDIFVAIQAEISTAVALKFKEVCVRMGAERNLCPTKPAFLESLPFDRHDPGTII